MPHWEFEYEGPDVMCRSMNICLPVDICEQLKRNLTVDLRRAEFVGDPEAKRPVAARLQPPACLY